MKKLIKNSIFEIVDIKIIRIIFGVAMLANVILATSFFSKNDSLVLNTEFTLRAPAFLSTTSFSLLMPFIVSLFTVIFYAFYFISQIKQMNEKIAILLVIFSFAMFVMMLVVRSSLGKFVFCISILLINIAIFANLEKASRKFNQE